MKRRDLLSAVRAAGPAGTTTAGLKVRFGAAPEKRISALLSKLASYGQIAREHLKTTPGRGPVMKCRWTAREFVDA